MGRPINKRAFGLKAGALACTYHNGTAPVTGTIVSQLGSNKFLCTDGTTPAICLLAQTTAAATTLTAGFMTITVAKFGGGTENVSKFLNENQVLTTQGSRLHVKLGTAGALAGDGTVTVVANAAPTVANAIPNQTGTVAAAFSYVIPANTFADANGDTLTLSATTTGAAALSTIGFAFDPVTKTLSKAAGASTAAAQTIIVTATDTSAATVSSTFTVTLS